MPNKNYTFKLPCNREGVVWYKFTGIGKKFDQIDFNTGKQSALYFTF